MPVKPLSFKGDKPPKTSSSKKRKLDSSTPTNSTTTTAVLQNAGTNTAAAAAAADDDDTWLTPHLPAHVAGPVIVVLPTSPPTALATDSNGAVFALEIENMVEQNPRTSEPSDVRCVWVVGKIPVGSGTGGGAKRARRDGDGAKGLVQVEGEEEEDGDGDGGAPVEVSLKSCYGNYLGVDEKGGLRAQSVAVGRAETLRIRRVENEGGGGFGIETSSSSAIKDTESGFISATKSSPIKIRSDGPPLTQSSESYSPSTLIIRMQARFHPHTVQARSQKASDKEKISRSELEKQVGRKLDDEEVKKLKRAYRRGELREEMLVLRVQKGRDKFA